jgi:hypothetical protein
VSLSGNLGSFSLDEVLSLLGHTSKSGALHVRDRETGGVLYMVDGRLCAAEMGDASGPVDGRHGLELRLVDAVLTLGNLLDGSFEFEPDRAAPFPTTDAIEVGAVVERTRALRARWPAIERFVPSLDAPVSLVAGLRNDTITLDRPTWAAVAAVDGRRSSRSIARVVGDSAFEVAAALAPLVDAGAVAIDAVEREPVTDGVFERGTFAAPIEIDEREPSGSLADLAFAAVDSEPIEPGPPVTEGPEALARLNRAELERAALGEPVHQIDPVHQVDPVDPVEPIEPAEPIESPVELPTPSDAEAAEELPAAFAADQEPDVHSDLPPGVARDRGSLLRMFSALRDG